MTTPYYPFHPTLYFLSPHDIQHILTGHLVTYLFILTIIYSFFLLDYKFQKDLGSSLDLKHVNTT